MKIRLGHLYPHSMNTYGDNGNLICLQQRAAWRDFTVEIIPLEIGTPIPKDINLYFFGGGQDAAQASLAKDLREKAERILQDVQAGTPLLAICGGYQLLGYRYLPFDSDPIPGIGLFPVETKASHDRMIGNLVIEGNPILKLDPQHPHIVGFENHSGKTTIVDTKLGQSLGKVVQGFGNNGSDQTEGCIINNAIGCYLHGSLLPKNPHLADRLLSQAFQKAGLTDNLSLLDDTLEWQAHTDIVGRYVAR
jgi:hypothetical protein